MVNVILSMSKKLDIAAEVDLRGYSNSLLVNLRLLALCQAQQPDAREASLASFARTGKKQLEEARRFMKFASAAYGLALMRAFGLLPPRSAASLKLPADLLESQAICEHTGLASADLVKVATKSLDAVGDAECLRHLVAVDHASSAVVLALRGMASVSDVVHDAVPSPPLCT